MIGTILKDKKKISTDEISTTYTIKIGKGDSDSDFLALRMLNEEVYLKTDDKVISSEKIDRYYSILGVVNSLNHPNIVKTFGLFDGDKKTAPTFLDEYYSLDLTMCLKTLSDVEIVCIIYEISHAMMKIHSVNLIHRNLKPNNILIDSNKHAKVKGFGFSLLVTPEIKAALANIQFSYIYSSPETLQEDDHFEEKVDVYSFGMIMYYILAKGNLPKIKLTDILNGKKVPVLKTINKISYSIIKNCLSYSPRDRPSFKAITQTIAKNNFKLIDGVEDKLDEIKENLKPIISQK